MAGQIDGACQVKCANHKSQEEWAELCAVLRGSSPSTDASLFALIVSGLSVSGIIFVCAVLPNLPFPHDTNVEQPSWSLGRGVPN